MFRDGDVIFREGDASRSAFVLVEGNVELTKEGEKGPVTLALLDPGEMFGEMGILDQSARSATARAVGEVIVRVIPRDKFLHSLRSEPDMALSVMGKLVQRLRTTTEMMVDGTSGAPDDRTVAGKPPKPGFWQRLFGFSRRTRAAANLEIRITPLLAPDGTDFARPLAAALDKNRRVRVRPLPGQPDPASAATADERILALAHAGRKLLADSSADLLISGEVPPPGTALYLRFVTALPEEDDRPGYFGPFTVLNLPAEAEPEAMRFLLAIAIAIVVPRDEAQATMLRDALPAALEAAQPFLAKLPPEMTSRERATVHLCHGNLALQRALQLNSPEHLGVAVEAYRAVLGVLTRDADPLGWALANRNLGMALQAIADREDDEKVLDQTVDCFTAALKVFTRERFPRQWGTLKSRLGWVFYKIDLVRGDTERLKQSLAVLQEALQVYTRNDSPLRWAEIMNDFAQVAQLLGEHLRNPELLRKAVEACRSALQVRRKREVPLLWAATQNNLGSALFLLGKLEGEVPALESAADAFAQARAVYLSHGSARTAKVAERNLAHVERLLEKKGVRGLPRMRWEKDEAPEGVSKHPGS